jgi:hypothetical protein
LLVEKHGRLVHQLVGVNECVG